MSEFIVKQVAHRARDRTRSQATRPTKVPAMSLHERCQKIDMLVMDVDGVLTDGGIVYTDQGGEIKGFHARDGSGLKIWMALGKQAGVLTGRESTIVARRAAELGVNRVLQGVDDKLTGFRMLLQEHDLKEDQAAYLGDDVPDLPVLRSCGLAVAVADACPEARELAHYVTRTSGGRGAVRETIELVLRAQGRWQEAVARFLA
jgi:3-deoxy-D-manno-octulosonate 8-phosphate phosphatase (KDO 8-P phosphatase)